MRVVARPMTEIAMTILLMIRATGDLTKKSGANPAINVMAEVMLRYFKFCKLCPCWWIHTYDYCKA